jgi:protein-tyrosine phosphatase
MATDFRPSYVTFFETITQPDVLATVFHCAAGRDRTGVAAALLLDVLDVEDELIVADYHATGSNLQPHAHRYSRVATEIGMSDEEFAKLLMTDPAAMTEFLAFLRETYGGAERYLVEGGLDSAMIAEVRGRLSETD